MGKKRLYLNLWYSIW